MEFLHILSESKGTITIQVIVLKEKKEKRTENKRKPFSSMKISS